MRWTSVVLKTLFLVPGVTVLYHSPFPSTSSWRLDSDRLAGDTDNSWISTLGRGVANRNWVGIQAEQTQEKHKDIRVHLYRTSSVFRFQSGPGCIQIGSRFLVKRNIWEFRVARYKQTLLLDLGARWDENCPGRHGIQGRSLEVEVQEMRTRNRGGGKKGTEGLALEKLVQKEQDPRMQPEIEPEDIRD